jgi:uncharacterized protein
MQVFSQEPRSDFAFVLRGKIQRFMSGFYDRRGWRKFDSNDFKIEHVKVEIANLPAAFHNYRIVQISDIHFGQWISTDRLRGAIDLINQSSPDVVAITGDFASYSFDEEKQEMATLLSKLKAKDGVLAVLGNHDHWAGAEKVRALIKESNICDISNNIFIVQKGDAQLIFAGIDSVMEKKDQLGLVLQKMPAEGPAVLLVHEPDFAVKSAATKRFSLQLSGHSHGGQFIIPGLGTPFRGRLFMKYPVGRYSVGEMVQYTNRGLGTNGFWIRISCPPEITVVSLF